MSVNKTTTKSISGIDILFVDNSPLASKLTVEEQKEIERIDRLPEVSPCEISSEHCELVAKQKARAEKLIQNITKKKYTSDHKSEEIRIRVSEEEKDNIEQKAKEYGFVNLSDFIRVAVMNCKIHVDLDSKKVPSGYLVVSSELNDISNQIYDLTNICANDYTINLIKDEDDIDNLGKLISAANNTISKLNNVVSNCNTRINQKIHKDADNKIQEHIDSKKGKVSEQTKQLKNEWKKRKTSSVSRNNTTSTGYGSSDRKLNGNLLSLDQTYQQLKENWNEVKSNTIEITNLNNVESMLIERSDIDKTNTLISDPISDVGRSYPSLDDEDHIHGDN